MDELTRLNRIMLLDQLSKELNIEIKFSDDKKLSNRERVYRLAESMIGTKEIPGGNHNPKIVEMHKSVSGVAYSDETAWCAAYVGWCLQECGLESTKSLAARSYLEYGKEVSLVDAKQGDIVVFWRSSPTSWKGHVGFFAGRSGASIQVLGGNQNNQVSIATYSTDRLLSVRRIEG